MNWDPVNQKVNLGGSAAGSAALAAAPVSTDGNVTLDAASNLYTIKPDSAVTVALDAAAVGSSRFLLALDFSSGVQSVTMPENFRWNGNAPNMSLKGIHTVDVVYMSTDEVNAFTGTYLGRVANPIDPNKGVVTYINGTLKEDWCGDEFQDLTIEAGGWDEEGYDIDESVTVNVNQDGILNGKLELYSSSSGELTAIINGGTVGNITTINEDAVLELQVIDGVVGSVGMNGATGSTVFQMTGGTVGSASFWEMYTQQVKISGGTINALRIGMDSSNVVIEQNAVVGTLSHEDYGITVTMRGGYVALSEFGWGMPDDTTVLNVSGGTIGTLRHKYCSTTATANLNGATIGELQMSFNITDNALFAPNIGTNCTVERISFVFYDYDVAEDTISFSFSVGANSVVKLDKTMQELVTLGRVTINADPTAQIINLED